MRGTETLEAELLNYGPVLTAQEVSQILKIGRVKAYELLKTGEIQSFRIGKRNIRCTKRSLINYLERGGS